MLAKAHELFNWGRKCPFGLDRELDWCIGDELPPKWQFWPDWKSGRSQNLVFDGDWYGISWCCWDGLTRCGGGGGWCEAATLRIYVSFERLLLDDFKLVCWVGDLRILIGSGRVDDEEVTSGGGGWGGGSLLWLT